MFGEINVRLTLYLYIFIIYSWQHLYEYIYSILTHQSEGTHEDTYLIPKIQLMYTSVHSDVVQEIVDIVTKI